MRLAKNTELRDFFKRYKQEHGVNYVVERFSDQRAAYSKANPSRTRWPESSRASDDRRRLRKADGESEAFTRAEVYERDGWVCQLCDEPVDRELRWPHPRSASLDHVIPLSKDGPHTRANAQLAHLECNIRKSNRVDGLELPGDPLVAG